MHSRNIGGIHKSYTRSRLAPSSAVTYIKAFVGPCLRPNEKMPLEAHEEAGRLLKEVYANTYYRRHAHNRVNIVRSTLDDWAMSEYPDHKELPQEAFFKLYYHTPIGSFQHTMSAIERDRHIESLRKVKSIVQRHYPDSKPLRSLLKLIDSAIKSLETWN